MLIRLTSRPRNILLVTAMAVLLGGVASSHAQADVIPAGRRIPWAGHVGVPGGIPGRTTVFATIDAATYGTGATDASAVINEAVRNCPPDQVVYLPEGTYRLESTVSFGHKEGVTLRGAGMGKTVLKPADGVRAAISTGQAGLADERRILSGSTKGSTSIVVEDATGIEPGLILDIRQDDDPDFYWTRGLRNHTGQYVMVTAVDGTTVRFDDPLVWSFNLNPRCSPSRRRGARWCGIEDMTITAGSSYRGGMIRLWNAYACWTRNVETAWGKGNDHIWLHGCLRCEIRDCYIHDTYSTTDGYGIVTQSGYGGLARGGCTGTLIENNIFSGLWGATVLETEVGSVIGYNLARNMRYPGWPDYQMYGFNGNHGPHGMMCLFEGNVAGGGVIQDGYHGSVSHITYFRNYFSGTHVEPHRTGNIKLIDLCRFSYYHNVVGNVLGSKDWPANGVYEMKGMPDYVSQPCVYRLGYPNMGNNGYSETNPPSVANGGGHDPKVKATLLRHGNYDFLHKEVVWDPDVPDRELPASLYLNGKPDWWGDAPWPPIGPDVPGLTHKIPAQARHERLEAVGQPAPG